MHVNSIDIFFENCLCFRSCKYEMKISTTTMAALKRYLTSHGHVILLQVVKYSNCGLIVFIKM